MAKTSKGDNLGPAKLFVLFVLGLIILSFLVKAIFYVKDSKFDGRHQFNIEVISKNKEQVISLSPPTRAISILTLVKTKQDISKSIQVPIDSTVTASNQVNKNNLSGLFFKTLLPFGNSYKNMNFIDAFRIFMYSRSILASSVYERDATGLLNDQQTATLISLTFTDPTIYQENKSIEIINATNAVGLGNRLANAITNIGGNVVLVTSGEKIASKSQILYYGDTSYTVERLADILKFETVKTDKKSIADVIIIIGQDERISF